MGTEKGVDAGNDKSADAWLDVHFAACRPEYEAMLRSVGLQPGWRVLDAGCGCDSFLPLMAALLGPAGHIAAYDLAPDTIATVERRRWDRWLRSPMRMAPSTRSGASTRPNTSPTRN